MLVMNTVILVAACKETMNVDKHDVHKVLTLTCFALGCSVVITQYSHMPVPLTCIVY
jgi:hypothetical protein